MPWGSEDNRPMNDTGAASKIEPINPGAFAACVAWAVVVALGGGISCGWLMTRVGTPGAIGLMILGIVAGLVAWRIGRRTSSRVGAMLAVAVLIAFVIANLWWLRYTDFVRGQNADTWLDALQMFLTLPQIAPTRFFMSLVCACFGAYNAYSGAGRRWHRTSD